MKSTDQQREDTHGRDNNVIYWEEFDGMRIGYDEYAKAQIDSCLLWQGLIADIGIKMIIFKRDYLDGIFDNGFESGVGHMFPKQHKGPEIFCFITTPTDRRAISLKVEIKDTGIAFEQRFSVDGYRRGLSEISPFVRQVFQIESRMAKESVKELLDYVFTQLPLCIVKKSIYDKFFEHVKAEQAKG